MSLPIAQIKRILEAAIFTAQEPLSVSRLQQLFVDESEPLSVKAIRQILQEVAQDYYNKGIELKEVASGYRFQARLDLAPWLARLQQERPMRYSRAFLETLALIAYRQPITRGEIEAIRGVAVNSQAIKVMMEREWVCIVGYREVPGKPALFGTTKQFLAYFNLSSLADLPPLSEINDHEEVGGKQLAVELL